MPRTRPVKHPRTPQLCRHPDGRAYVRLKGKFHYLGKHGTPEATQRYHALMAELAATGLPAPADRMPSDLTVAEALDLYVVHARGYYRAAPGVGGQIDRVRAACLACTDLYGLDLAEAFGPLKLRAVQAELVRRGYCRTNINSMVGCLKLAFKWLASLERVPATVPLALSTVPGLRAGKTEAKESEPVKPVPEAHIAATCAVLPPTLKAMVALQLACGARPGEIMGLRPCDLDRTGAVWTAELKEHKTAARGKARVLYFGPKAQAVLRPFLLDRGPADCLFRPADAIAQRAAAAPTHRRPNQKPNPRRTERTVGDRYDTRAYCRAIARAVAEVNRAAAKEGKPAIPVWHPHQLRHNAGTAVRKAFGLEAAQVILGHSKADITQLYAETDRERALAVAEQIG